ncbi:MULTISPECIES: Crp/Fnr family transcriptional regulator [Marinobacter]|uniref:Crp/Fnr family transcriptional regulator n=1 Tax=Marinobacter TaxID=2742 RepID=UPI001781D7D1|nr:MULTISPECIES: Crp/Fnr family transcriptional regulator [Marinobacter]MBL3556489.1 Crp/Fnr family transcriptional regulator [Marinobacter sp. JB05H06]
MAEELIKALTKDSYDVSQLSEDERLLLAEIKPQRLHFEKDSVVFREEEPANYFLLMKEGICFNHRHLEDGSRQVMDLYFPGEVIALSELPLEAHVSGLTTLSDAVILAYDKAEITEKCSRTARLSRLFMELLFREQAILTERLVEVARHSANKRVAHFLLDINQRLPPSTKLLHHAGADALSACCSPKSLTGLSNLVGIPQVLIADALGLSIVHVNRVLRQFKEAGWIRIRSQGIELLDIDALKVAAGWESEGEARSILHNQHGALNGDTARSHVKDNQ